MPLTELQRMAVKVLRPFRTAHDFVGGGAALNRDWARLSDDMDIFHDYRDQLPRRVEPELEALRAAGFSVETTVSADATVEVILRRYGFETKVQWLDDPETCRRFFPAVDDDDFGFRLHQADVAVNKILCASRRRSAPRDAVDLVTILEYYSPLGPLIWAAVGKDSNLTPPRIIQNIRNIVFGYSDEEIRAVRVQNDRALSRNGVRAKLAPALDAAGEYCETTAPADFTGCLFVDATEVPIEADLESLKTRKAKAIPIKDFTALPSVR